MEKTLDGIRIFDGEGEIFDRLRESFQVQDDLSNFADEMFLLEGNFLESGPGCFDLEYCYIIHNDFWRPFVFDRIEMAEDAISRGFIPIPLKKKRPYLPKWQQTKPEDALRRIKREVKRKALDNIGVLTGEPSGIVVLDIDYKPENFEYPNTFVVETSRGYHLYFKYDPRFNENRSKINGKKIDLKSNGGQIVYPGSEHEDGTLYTIVNDAEIIEMPDDIVEFLEGKRKSIF